LWVATHHLRLRGEASRHPRARRLTLPQCAPAQLPIVSAAKCNPFSGTTTHQISHRDQYCHFDGRSIRTCSALASHFLSSPPSLTFLKKASRRRAPPLSFSCSCSNGLGLTARLLSAGVLCFWHGDGDIGGERGKVCGRALALHGERGEDIFGAYGKR